MSLEKLTIRYERGQKNLFTGLLSVLFNPTQVSYSKSVNWERVDSAAGPKSKKEGLLLYRSSPAETMTVELFFDTYSGDATGALPGVIPFLPPASRSVIPSTDEVAALASLDKSLQRPPVCILFWGKSQLFRGVLQQVSRTLLLFLEDGTPVRATMGCTFLEAPEDAGAAGELLHLADVAKQYVIRPGDTLMSIAGALYGDIAQWRRIAEANQLEDPRLLLPGQTLSIPRIR